MSDEANSAAAPLHERVDPRLLSALARWERNLPVRDHELVRTGRAPRIHLDPADWGAGYLAVRERELPAELHADLRDLTPQALLRDLHRPVRQSVWVDREPVGDALDPGARRAWAEVRESRRLAPLPTIEPLSRAVGEEQVRRRALMGEPWQPYLADDQPRREFVVPIEPSLTR